MQVCLQNYGKAQTKFMAQMKKWLWASKTFSCSLSVNVFLLTTLIGLFWPFFLLEIEKSFLNVKWNIFKIKKDLIS